MLDKLFLNQKHLTFGSIAIGLFGMAIIQPALAVRFANGAVAFDRPPELVQAVTRSVTPAAPGSFHFTIEVPSNAGEPLEAAVISPYKNFQEITFDLEDTKANVGKAFARGESLTLSSVGGATNNPQDVLVVFEDPIMPGTTVTITLSGRTPSRGGVYQYGVTAYPAGENPIGHFLGYGRFNFFTNN